MYSWRFFEIDDLLDINPHPLHEIKYVNEESYKEAAEQKGSVSIFHDGSCIACMGIITLYEGRGYIWSIMGEDAGKHMVKIHKIATSLLEQIAPTMRRIEAYVDCDFPQAIRWIKMLGFEKEGIMKNFNPNGTDASLWARYK